MTQQLWLAVLSSSVISGAIGALIAGFFSIRVSQRNFKNDYFKTVLQKRITAYEELEKLAHAFKTSVMDADRKPYHLPFSKDDDYEFAHTLVFKVMMQSLWISEEAFCKIRDLSDLLYRLQPSENNGAIEFGKKNYEKIALLRGDLETIIANDMLTLHEVKRFLKQKKKDSVARNKIVERVF